MAYQIRTNQVYEIELVPDLNNRVIKVTGVDQYDLENIEEIADLIVDIRQPIRFHDILTNIVLDQDQMWVDDIIASLNNCYQGRENELIQLAINDLDKLYEAEQISDRPVDQAVQYGLWVLNDKEITETEMFGDLDILDAERKHDQIAGYHLTIVGQVLKEICFGTEPTVMIRA